MPTVLRSSLLRFSIRHLLIGTGLVALSCVALRGASATWVAVVFALVLMNLTGSLLLLIFRQGEARAYWIGFALVIGLYLLVLSGGWGLDQNSHPLSANNLITGGSQNPATSGSIRQATYRSPLNLFSSRAELRPVAI